jgi:hypothetical protein
MPRHYAGPSAWHKDGLRRIRAGFLLEELRRRHGIGLPMHIRFSSSLIFSLLAISPIAMGEWKSTEVDGRLSASHAGVEQVGLQVKPLSDEKAGPAFLPSAFLHPLTTPAGFVCTAVMPSDHVHHLGVWWPWKHIKIDGKTYNCWELQNGEGAHHTVAAKILSADANTVEWEIHNEVRIRKPGEKPGPPVLDGITAIRENVRIRIARHGDNANVLDLTLRQTAGEQPVTIEKYRYSGFAWRGPESWIHSNSAMTTCNGLDRDKANGSEGRWVLVTGPAVEGATASVLVMSAAKDIAGTPERLRVWDSKAHNGTPFVNFNPVQQNSLPLNEDNPAVSHRQYRIITADGTLTVAQAEAEWQAWRATANGKP